MLESEGQCTYIRVCLVCVCVWEEGRDAQRHTQYIQNFISRSLLLRLVTSRGKRVSVQTRLRIKLRLVKTSRCAVTLQVHFHSDKSFSYPLPHRCTHTRTSRVGR
jgi:hypothetical protein